MRNKCLAQALGFARSAFFTCLFSLFLIGSCTAAARAEDPAPAVSTGTITLAPILIEAPTVFQSKMQDMDQSRDNFLLPKIGATSYSMNQAAIQALPQGTDTPIDKLVLQAPGVSYDSAVSNPDFHIRNEYANAQTRINGILLPEGVSGLGPVLETGFIGNFDLLTGALPAQYGLRTAGVLDLTTKSEFKPGGDVSLYAGSFGTLSPSFDYGGSAGSTQYFFTGSFTENSEGLENPTSSVNPTHDESEQYKYFGYLSTLLGESSRLTFMSGGSVSSFQIPNNPGQSPLGDYGSPTYDSSDLNENERDTYFFNILALQTKGEDYDSQVSVFSRYTSIHFIPDVYGDLVFNDVASDVTRKSLLNGLQFDDSYRLNEAHTLRAGFAVTAEETQIDNLSTVLPLDQNGNPLPTPETIDDADSQLGWNLGGYVQDEWKLTHSLTLNAGLRFDQLYQYVNANQVSPRVALVDKLTEDTTAHIGYARYFTPPMQAQGATSNVALFNNTTQQPVVAGNDPVLPERSHYFDAGVDQTLLPGWTAGVDAYYKIATDALDDGQFGSALVLTQFNYANEYSEGAEFKTRYQNDGFTAYGNFSANQTQAKDVVSNQYLFDDPVEFAYIANNYHFTDDDQAFTASAGTSYRWDRMLASVDDIYGSGLRSGFGNLQHVPGYDVVNVGLSRDFDTGWKDKPLTVRFEVVNLFDMTYMIRSGTGIGEFAPQYGQRRGFFVTISQKI